MIRESLLYRRSKSARLIDAFVDRILPIGSQANLLYCVLFIHKQQRASRIRKGLRENCVGNVRVCFPQVSWTVSVMLQKKLESEIARSHFAGGPVHHRDAWVLRCEEEKVSEEKEKKGGERKRTSSDGKRKRKNRG